MCTKIAVVLEVLKQPGPTRLQKAVVHQDPRCIFGRQLQGTTESTWWLDWKQSEQHQIFERHNFQWRPLSLKCPPTFRELNINLGQPTKHQPQTWSPAQERNICHVLELAILKVGNVPWSSWLWSRGSGSCTLKTRLAMPWRPSDPSSFDFYNNTSSIRNQTHCVSLCVMLIVPLSRRCSLKTFCCLQVTFGTLHASFSNLKDVRAVVNANRGTSAPCSNVLSPTNDSIDTMNLSFFSQIIGGVSVFQFSVGPSFHFPACDLRHKHDRWCHDYQTKLLCIEKAGDDYPEGRWGQRREAIQCLLANVEVVIRSI